MDFYVADIVRGDQSTCGVEGVRWPGERISRSGNSAQMIIKTYFTIIELLISFTHTQSFLFVYVYIYIYIHRKYTNTAEV